jgi:hypothetical protein
MAHAWGDRVPEVMVQMDEVGLYDSMKNPSFGMLHLKMVHECSWEALLNFAFVVSNGSAQAMHLSPFPLQYGEVSMRNVKPGMA